MDTRPLPREPGARPSLPHAPDDLGGAAFAGRYRLRNLRGEGGMAMVYEAVDLHSGKPVAVKMLRHELLRNQEARFRFDCEAQMLARVAHPNVVSMRGLGHAAGGRPFLVMEYLEGRNLGEVIGEEGPLPPERAFRIALQACRGLQAAHRAGIIHRDLKPENLFVCAGQRGGELVKVLDFGIAKVRAPSDPLAQTIEALDCGRVVGTPHYMAPEQVCEPGNVDEQTDVFSLGVVLCEALTGVRPHDGKSGGTIIDELLTDPVSAVAAYHPSLAQELEEVIALAYAPDRRVRYASARHFGAALSAALRAPAACLSACSPRRS